jgi:hypothetical protein
VGACAGAGLRVGLLTAGWGAGVRFWADIALVTGCVGGLLRSCLKNSPTMGFGGSDGLETGMATIGQGKTTESGLGGGDGVWCLSLSK